MKLFFFDLKPSTMSVALSFVLLTGCVTTKPDPEPWSKDKGLVLQSLQDAHMENARLKEKLALFDLRILDLERLNAEQQTKVEALESSLLAQKQAGVKKKGITKPRKKKNLTKRLDKMSAKLATPTQVKPSLAKNKNKPNADTDEKNTYTAAYLALKSGRYDDASSGFVKVIKAHPKGEYTDQAYYWLGESLVALLRNPEALESFTVVANQYPKSPKHAAALLKIASVYKSMKYYEQAKATLNRLLKEHPEGVMAERARNELKALPQADGAKK